MDYPKGVGGSGRIPNLPYTQYKGSKEHYKLWEYEYDAANDQYRCCPCATCIHRGCGANEKGQKVLQRHIWQEHLDLVEQLQKTERGKVRNALRKETIAHVFGDAKEKHTMRYTQHRGLARVTTWVRLKFAAMNLKKLAMRAWASPAFCGVLAYFIVLARRIAVFSC